MKKSGLLIIAGVAIVSLAALVWLSLSFEEPSEPVTLVIEPPTPISAEPDPEPAPRAVIPPAQTAVTAVEPAEEPEPVIEIPAQPEVEPVPEPPAESDEPEVVLPSLNDSDGFVRERLQALRDGAALLGLIADDQLIRKFVVFVENTSRHEFPQTDLPYRSIGVEMPVRELDQNLFRMEDDAYTRFDGFIDTMTAVDTEQAYALYRLLRPLFQQAYAEIGYRGRDFDDALRQAINNVLQATDVEGPFQLVKPSVMYLFADSELENADAVHKQLIRIGPRNSTRLMAKLAEFVVLL